MLQRLLNRSICHHTDSQRPLISFLSFQVICGSIAMVRSQQSQDVDKILEIFFTFSSLEGKVIKTTKAYKLKHDW